MIEKITLAGGCFWCTEAIFKRLKGVSSVIPGYSGGKKENPTYEDVSMGNTSYAEAVQIEFDSQILPLEKLLQVFFTLHDPTTLNRQGADVGTQYRSAIFYHTENQKQMAEKIIQALQPRFSDKIVTEVIPYSNFYKAEENHMDYYATHSNQPYCKLVIDPKIKKLYKEFKEEIK
ncbi:peptide-methionine (S)-S-oxide reductase MsrA [Candidatus Microgenomates bacterium]|nr:peptide-methionine (S)-S-oxide reductase MsrA [Candidatus Microgenomates bacterium]